MLSQDEADTQRELLASYRRTLAHLLKQTASYGGEIFAPPPVMNGIYEAREHVRHIKEELRRNGLVVLDKPNDNPVSSPEGDSADDIYPTSNDLLKWINYKAIRRDLSGLDRTNPTLIRSILNDLLTQEEGGQEKTLERWNRDVILAAQICTEQDGKYLSKKESADNQMHRKLRRSLLEFLQDKQSPLVQKNECWQVFFLLA